MSNVEQQSIVFAINEKFLAKQPLTLKDFDSVTNEQVLNRFAKTGVLNELVLLLAKAPEGTENIPHYKNLAKVRIAEMDDLKGISSELGISHSNMGWLRNNSDDDKGRF